VRGWQGWKSVRRWLTQYVLLRLLRLIRKYPKHPKHPKHRIVRPVWHREQLRGLVTRLLQFRDAVSTMRRSSLVVPRRRERCANLEGHVAHPERIGPPNLTYARALHVSLVGHVDAIARVKRSHVFQRRGASFSVCPSKIELELSVHGGQRHSNKRLLFGRASTSCQRGSQYTCHCLCKLALRHGRNAKANQVW